MATLTPDDIARARKIARGLTESAKAHAFGKGGMRIDRVYVTEDGLQVIFEAAAGQHRMPTSTLLSLYPLPEVTH